MAFQTAADNLLQSKDDDHGAHFDLILGQV